MSLFDNLFRRQNSPTTAVSLEEAIQKVGVSEFVQNLSEDVREEIRENIWNRSEFDTPYANANQERHLGVPGRFTILREWSFIERKEILERSHQVWERNPLANAAVTYTTQFSIGEGGTFSYSSKESREIIQEFIQDPENNFESYEKEFCDAIQVDGELFVRFFSNQQGRMVIAPLRPWHIQWVTTERGFFKRIISYHHVFAIYKEEPTEVEFGQEDIPANDVLHAAINRLPYENRGRPELFRVLPWLRAYKDWLEDRARINKRKGTLLYDVTIKNGRPDIVQAKQAQYRQPPTSGSLLIHNEQEEWNVLSAKIEAGDAAEDGRQFKLMVAAGLRLPEFMFSDGANASLASARAQQLPALRKFTNFQDILEKQVWKPIFRRVIQSAVDSGRIKEYVQEVDSLGNPIMEEPSAGGLLTQAFNLIKSGKILEAVNHVREAIDQGATPRMVRAVDSFDYQYPDIEGDNPQNLAAALAIMTQNKWISKNSATHKLGFDPTLEKDKIRREDAEELNAQLEQAMAFDALDFGGDNSAEGFGNENPPFGAPIPGNETNFPEQTREQMRPDEDTGL